MELKLERTTVAVRPSTKRMLDEYGVRGDSYDDIIRR